VKGDRLPDAEPIFQAAADLPPESRAAILAERCGEDAELLALVKRLLALHDRGLGSFLQPSADETASKTIQDDSHESTSIGPYRILETIGEGGMGTVYHAEQSKPIHRRVALKVIKPGMDSKQVIARFEVEREALALMDHPNIAKVLDAGETEQGGPYFVMDLVKGEPITEYCDRHTLSTRERLDLFIPVCRAVQHAHQKGIIHRDLKPSNILVTTSDGKPVPKVIDFGIAKATTATLTEKTLFTQQGQLIGTPAYMSPEQAEVGPLDVDTRSDVYSLGVILYELLAGVPPFDPKTLQKAGLVEIQRIIREEEPPKPSTKVSTAGEDSKEVARRHHTDSRTLVHELRGELDWIVLKAMEKERTRRYETASSLALDIRRFMRDEPIEASPPSALYRSRKFAKRHKVPIGVAAAILITLLGALIYSSIQWRLTQVARDESEEARNESEAVTKFLSDMLASVDPGKQGREVTVKEVLEEAAKTIGENFPDQPLIEARLRQTIGNTYLALGDLEAAEQQLEPASEIRRQVLGEEHEQTMVAIANLARVYSDLDRNDEAAVLLEKSLEISRRVLGEEHPETISTMVRLVAPYGRLGRYDDAESLLVKTLSLSRRVLGEEHQDTIGTINNLALVYRLQGRYDDAESLLVETLEVRRRVLGEEHLQTLQSMRNLAIVYRAQGRYGEAEALHKEILEFERRVLGEEHPNTLRTKHNLAVVYFDLGRYDDAEPLIESTLEINRRVRGDDHPNTLWSMVDLASLYMNQSRYTEAEALFRDGLDGQRRVLGEEHPTTLWTMNDLADMYRAQGRHDDSESLLAKTLEISRRVMGEKHERTLQSLYLLTCNASGRGDRSTALDWLRQAAENGLVELDAEDPRLVFLHGDPEFDALVAEVRRRNEEK
jgi:serine/threonine protein kinase/Flp pilus assembly protein TadD